MPTIWHLSFKIWIGQKTAGILKPRSRGLWWVTFHRCKIIVADRIQCKLFEKKHVEVVCVLINKKLKYSGDLKSGLVWITNDRERLGCNCSRFQLGSEIWTPNHLKSVQMTAILSKNIEIWTKSLDFIWCWDEASCKWECNSQAVGTIAIAKALPFENQTI